MPGSPRDIWRYYERTLDSFEIVLRCARQDPQALARTAFAAMAAAGADEAAVAGVLAEMTRELELEVSLALAAAFEAIIRQDFQTRVDGPRLAPVDRSLGALHDTTDGEPRFRDMLDRWKAEFPAGRDEVGQLKVAVVNLRNWLAHGREGAPKGCAGLGPEDVVARAREAQRAIADFPRLVDW